MRDRSASIVNGARPSGHSLRFRYQVPGFPRGDDDQGRAERDPRDAATERVVCPAPPRIDGTDVVWDVELPPRCRLVTLLNVGLRVNNDVLEPVHADFGERLRSRSRAR